MSSSKGKKRLWIVSELYYPEMTSTGYYMTMIGEGLAGDFEVNVIAGQPNYSAKGTAAPKVESRNNVTIHRAFGTRLNKNIILFKLMNMLTLGLGVFGSTLSRFREGDRVLVVTTPPNLPFVAAVAALLCGASYTLLIHDNYPEILVAAGKTRAGSFLARTIGVANRWLYKNAARIIVVGRDMEKLIRQKTEGLDSAIAVIPNWAELETVSPATRNENPLVKELGLENSLIFLYAGNMGHPNDVESILGAASVLDGTLPVSFVFLGDGIKKNWIKKRIIDLSISNVVVLPPMPRPEQCVFLNACDVGIVSLVSGMWGVSMPSRTYNLLAAGKPILAIADADSEIDLLIEEHSVGWRVPPGSPQALSEKISEIYRERAELDEIGRRSRSVAVTEFNLETAMERYRKALA